MLGVQHVWKPYHASIIIAQLFLASVSGIVNFEKLYLVEHSRLHTSLELAEIFDMILAIVTHW